MGTIYCLGTAANQWMTGGHWRVWQVEDGVHGEHGKVIRGYSQTVARYSLGFTWTLALSEAFVRDQGAEIFFAKNLLGGGIVGEACGDRFAGSGTRHRAI